MRPRRVLIPALAAALAAGCATVESPRAPAEKPRERAARRAGPRSIPTRPLNVKADCAFRDPTGYRGAMRLQVADAQVRQFEATVTVPAHGSCSFALREFQQIAQMPNPVLKHRTNGCEVRVWEQGQRVTVAFVRCRDNCTSRGAFERLWPILTDVGNGSCG
jgi:hypothetical protein